MTVDVVVAVETVTAVELLALVVRPTDVYAVLAADSAASLLQTGVTGSLPFR